MESVGVLSWCRPLLPAALAARIPHSQRAHPGREIEDVGGGGDAGAGLRRVARAVAVAVGALGDESDLGERAVAFGLEVVDALGVVDRGEVGLGLDLPR